MFAWPIAERIILSKSFRSAMTGQARTLADVWDDRPGPVIAVTCSVVFGPRSTFAATGSCFVRTLALHTDDEP